MADESDPDPNALKPEVLPIAPKTFNQLVHRTDQREMFHKMGITTAEQLMDLLDSGAWTVFEGLWYNNDPTDTSMEEDVPEPVPSTSAACRAALDMTPFEGSIYGGISTIRGPNTIGQLTGRISHSQATLAMIRVMRGGRAHVPLYEEPKADTEFPRHPSKLRCKLYYGLLDNSLPNGRCKGKLFGSQTQLTPVRDSLMKRRTMFRVTKAMNAWEEKTKTDFSTSGSKSGSESRSKSGSKHNSKSGSEYSSKSRFEYSSKSGSKYDARDESDFESYHSSDFGKDSDKFAIQDNQEKNEETKKIYDAMREISYERVDGDILPEMEEDDMEDYLESVKFVNQNESDDNGSGGDGNIEDNDSDGTTEQSDLNDDILKAIEFSELSEEDRNAEIMKWVDSTSDTFEVEEDIFPDPNPDEDIILGPNPDEDVIPEPNPDENGDKNGNEDDEKELESKASEDEKKNDHCGAGETGEAQ